MTTPDPRFELLEVAREELEKDPGSIVGLIVFIDEEGQPRIAADATFHDGAHLSHLLTHLAHIVLDILPTVHERDVLGELDVNEAEKEEREPENLGGAEPG